MVAISPERKAIIEALRSGVINEAQANKLRADLDADRMFQSVCTLGGTAPVSNFGPILRDKSAEDAAREAAIAVFRAHGGSIQTAKRGHGLNGSGRSSTRSTAKTPNAPIACVIGNIIHTSGPKGPAAREAKALVDVMARVMAGAINAEQAKTELTAWREADRKVAAANGERSTWNTYDSTSRVNRDIRSAQGYGATIAHRQVETKHDKSGRIVPIAPKAPKSYVTLRSSQYDAWGEGRPGTVRHADAIDGNDAVSIAVDALLAGTAGQAVLGSGVALILHAVSVEVDGENRAPVCPMCAGRRIDGRIAPDCPHCAGAGHKAKAREVQYFADANEARLYLIATQSVTGHVRTDSKGRTIVTRSRPIPPVVFGGKFGTPVKFGRGYVQIVGTEAEPMTREILLACSPHEAGDRQIAPRERGPVMGKPMTSAGWAYQPPKRAAK